ncbi:hypothetical protein [Rubrivivax gelatinosus]|uniref:hypothetical protein n=1 Tax=Rubrivivax gelatinosus TaxID=28068 RepID=UPI0012FE05D5|nr:hypothetical protein [Rubrivivax gelatinosus]MBG6083129.1 hypothetical protein [Rubrivivax gelatinosus]
MLNCVSQGFGLEDFETMPRAPSWYAKEPFDPSVIAFRGNDGREWRYMNSPLDERYLAEPLGHFVLGSIPPEEREVRDTLVAAAFARRRVSTFQFWWSQIFGPTESYRVCLVYFRRLNQLCGCSREHRAAFCRLSNSDSTPPFIRRELKRIVDLCDRGCLA